MLSLISINKFLTSSEKEGICPNCQHVSNEVGKKICISNIIPTNRVQGFIYNEYLKKTPEIKSDVF